MAGRIPDDQIVAIKDANPIDRVVAEYLQLKTAGGGNLKGLCPFHDEKSPSFQVSPGRGFFHCFGCGVGGDVLSFLQKLENLSFSEAAEKLAARAGITVRYEGGGSSVSGAGAGQRQRLVEAHKVAMAFFKERLVSDPEAARGREFLANKGFSLADAEAFDVGFAPRGWDALTEHLTAKGFKREELIASSLAQESRRGSLIDRFRGRVLWPIADTGGDVIAFGARRLFDDDHIEGKYYNSPETALFKKSRVLYGLDRARREIGRRHQVVVVEGYTDVMACHLSGVPTAVAVCGTAFGDEHAVLLRRQLMDQDEFRGEVIFTFDGDAAGQKAAMRASAQDAKFTAQTFIAIAPGGQDPCDLRLSGGETAIVDLVESRIPLFEFVLRTEASRYDLDTPEGRTQALAKVVPVLKAIKDDGLRVQYLPVAARILGFTEVDPVRAALAAASPAEAARGRRSAAAPRTMTDPSVQVEREMLKAVLQRPVLVGAGFDRLEAEAFTHPMSQAVRDAVVKAGGVAAAETMKPQHWAQAVLDVAADDTVRNLVMQVAVEPLLYQGGDAAEQNYVVKLLPRLRELAVTRRIVELKGRLQRMSPIGDTADAYNRLWGELMALEGLKRDLREEGLS